MPEIVGSAYVRIKALTDGLAGDIQKGMDKGAGDVNVDSAGKKVGSSFSESVSKGVKEGAPNVRKEMESIGDGADDSGGFKWGQRWATKLYTGIEQASDKKKSKNIFQKISKGLDDFNDKLKIPSLALVGMFGSPAIGGAVKVLGSYIGALTSQVGFLATASVGAGAAIGGAFGLAALGVGPLLLAFKTQTPLLDLFQAKAKVFGEAWKDVGVATQTFLLPALTDVMRQSLKMIPMFEQFGARIGLLAGGVAEFGIKMLNSSSNAMPLQRIMKSSGDIFKIFGDSAVFIGDALIKLFATVSPLSERFAESVRQMAIRFDAFITRSSQSGELGKNLTIWYDRAEQIGRSFINLAKVVWNVFKIAADAGQPFFDTLSQTTQKWLDFTNSVSGQTKIKDAFDNMIPVAQQVNGLLSDLVKWITTPVLKGNTSGILAFFDTLRTVLLPALEGIAKQMTGQLSGALNAFVQSLSGFLQATAGAGELKTFFDILSKVLDVLSSIVAIPGMAQFVGILLSMAGAFKAIHVIAGPLTGILGSLGKVFQTSVGQAALAPVKDALLDFATGKGGLAGAKEAMGTFASGMGDLAASAFNPMTLAVGGITAAITIGIAAFTAWKTNVDRVKQEQKDFTKTLLEGGDAIDSLNTQYQKILDTRDSFDESFKATGFTMSNVTDVINKNVGDMDKFRAKWQDMGKTVEGFDIANGKIPQSLKNVIGPLFEMERQGKLSDNQVREVVDGLTDLDKEARSASEGIAHTATQMMEAGKAAGLTKQQLKDIGVAATGKSLDEQNKALQESIALYPQLAAKSGVAMSTINKVTAETNQQFSQIISKLKELQGGQTNADQATRDFQLSLINLGETFKSNGGKLAGNTKQALENMNALKSMADQGIQAAEAQAKIDTTGKKSTDTLKFLRQSILNMSDGSKESNDAVNALLQSMGILSDQDIQAKVGVETQQAAEDLKGLKDQIKNLPGVTDPVRAHLNALVDAGSIQEANAEMANWQKIQEARQVKIPIHGDTKPAVKEVEDLLGWTTNQDGTVTINGNPVPAKVATQLALDIANGSTGTIKIDGNTDPATGKTITYVANVNKTTGVVTVDANTDPAYAKLQAIAKAWNMTVEDIQKLRQTTGVLKPSAMAAIGGPAPKTGTASPGGQKTSTQKAAANEAAAAGMRATIANGRAAAARLLGTGLSSLLVPHALALSPNRLSTTADFLSQPTSDSLTVAVPSEATAAEPAVLHITVKIGDRDITEIVDVQMDNRMGQLATAIRRKA